jgi:hypothetical protein
MFKLMLAPVRLTAASVRGIAWTRGAFGRRRPRVIGRPSRAVIVRVVVVPVPPRPDLARRTESG